MHPLAALALITALSGTPAGLGPGPGHKAPRAAQAAQERRLVPMVVSTPQGGAGGAGAGAPGRFVDVYTASGSFSRTPVTGEETTVFVPPGDRAQVGYTVDNGDGTYSSGTCHEGPVATGDGAMRMQCAS